jgi:RHS repeat-associated protein
MTQHIINDFVSARLSSRIVSTILAFAGVLTGGLALAQQPANPYSYSRTSAFEYDATTGLLTKETVEPGAASGVVTTYQYDSYGNRRSSTVSNYTGASGSAVFTTRTSSWTNGAQTVTVAGIQVTSPAGAFQTVATNALNQSDNRTYDPRFGTPLSLVGPNSLATTWQVDDFGRVTLEQRADGTSTYTAYCYIAGRGPDTSTNTDATICAAPGANEIPALAISFTHSELRNGANGKIGAFSRVYFDGMGRKIRTVTEAFDGSTQPNGSGRLIVQDTDYALMGTVLIATEPYFLDTLSSTSSGSERYGMTMTLIDPLGRAREVYNTDTQGSQASIAFGARGSYRAARTGMAYAALVTVTFDDAGRSRKEEKNIDGRVIRSTDALQANVGFQYDAFDNLMKTKDALQNVIAMTYDVRGRKLTMSDPDTGLTRYDYDALGELVMQQTANQATNGLKTTMSYDVLGRVVQRVEPEYATAWYYDKYSDGTSCNKSVGKLCETWANNGVRRKYAYDNLGRVFSNRVDTSTQSFITNVSYDANGRVASQTYPTGLSVNYVYTPKGYLSRLNMGQAATINSLPAVAGGTAGPSATMSAGAFLWLAQSYNAWGNVDQQVYGNNVVGKTVYDPATGRVTSIAAGTGSNNYVMNYQYGWDSVGQVSNRTDAIGDGTTGAVTDLVAYDKIGRIQSYTVNAPALPGLQRKVTLQYNAIGMILAKSDVGVYSYPEQGATAVRPHAPQNVAGVFNSSYTYDANGNMKTATDGAYTSIGYTSFNMPASGATNGVAGPANRYGWQYDENHQRVQETAGSRTTWLLHPDNAGGLGFESESADASNQNIKNRHYLTAGGQTVGVLVSYGRLPTLTGAQTAPPQVTSVTLVKVEYWHKDYLGSLVSTSDHTAAVTQRYAYDPFGKRRVVSGEYDADGKLVYDWNNTNHGTDRGFTGHEHLDDVGIIHMNARLYDPRLGIFVQPDPLIQDSLNLQNYNPYGYCYNNPMSCTDPTGMLFGGLFSVPIIDNAWNHHIKPAIPTIASIAAAIYLGPASTVWTGATGIFSSAITQTAIAGFASGAIASGSFKGGLQGAVSALAFYGAGSFAEGKSLAWGIAAHGVVGCATAELGGGRCGAGALSAAFSHGVANTDLAKRIFGSGDMVASTALSAIVGGTGSVLGGGKFSNGAITGSFGYLFNCGAHPGTCKSDPFRGDPRSHEYEIMRVGQGGTVYICMYGEPSCTRDVVFQGLRRWPAPFSTGDRAVSTNDISFAGPFNETNPVIHVVDPDNYALFNITQKTHIFMDAQGAGYVYRNVQTDSRGIFIQTYGAGNGPNAAFNNGWVAAGGWKGVDRNIRAWYYQNYAQGQ